MHDAGKCTCGGGGGGGASVQWPQLTPPGRPAARPPGRPTGSVAAADWRVRCHANAQNSIAGD